MIAFEGKNRRIDLNVSLQNFPRTHKVSRESMKNQADLRFGFILPLRFILNLDHQSLIDLRERNAGYKLETFQYNVGEK